MRSCRCVKTTVFRWEYRRSQRIQMRRSLNNRNAWQELEHVRETGIKKGNRSLSIWLTFVVIVVAESSTISEVPRWRREQEFSNSASLEFSFDNNSNRWNEKWSKSKSVIFEREDNGWLNIQEIGRMTGTSSHCWCIEFEKFTRSDQLQHDNTRVQKNTLLTPLSYWLCTRILVTSYPPSCLIHL
jgi:hypothetical protein